MIIFIKTLIIILLLSWIGGCMGGAYLGNVDYIFGGFISFFILYILGISLNKIDL